MKKTLSVVLSVLMLLSVFTCTGGVTAAATEKELNYIEYTLPDGKFSFCEYTNGYWSYEYDEVAGEYEKVFIYSEFDLWQDGAVLVLDYIVEPSDGVTYTYTCVDGVFVNEKGEELDESDFYFYTNQQESPWTVGENTLFVCYGDKECEVKAEITESPVESIEFIPTEPIELRQNIDGYEYTDDNGVWQFEYDYAWELINEGNALNVTYKDGTEEVYVSDGEAYYNEQGDAVSSEEVIYFDTQASSPWTEVGEYFVEYYVMGYKIDVPVTVVANPVEAISFNTEEPLKYYENTNGLWSYSYEGEEETEFFLYSAPLYTKGTSVTVSYTDGTSAVYTYNENEYTYLNENGEELDFYLDNFSDQYETPWGIGEHSFTVTACGKTCTVPVTIVENPVVEFEFLPAKPLVFTYAEGGEWTTSYDENGEEIEVYIYDSTIYSPYEEGNAIILTLADGSEAEYIYSSEQGVFLDANGNAMPYDAEIMYIDVQIFVPWDESSAYNAIAVEFMGAYNAVPVIIENGVPADAQAPYVYNGVGEIYVEWEPVAGATEYWVFRKAGAQKSWQCVAKTDGFVYEDVSDIKDGQTYKYTVYGVNSNGHGGFSKAGTAVEYIAPVEGVKLENVAGNVKISWTDYEGVMCHVFRIAEGDEDWTYIASADGVGYYVLDPDAESGEEYTYSVIASRNGFDSGYDTASVKYLDTPTLKSISNATSGINVKWSAVEGAESYRVYRKGATGGWTLIQKTTKTSFTDTAVANKSGSTYKYTVKAVSGKYVSGYNKSGISIKRLATPEVSSIANVTSGIKLNWGTVKGATEYRVYRRVAGASDWTLVGKTAKTAFTDTAVKSKSGVTYEYTVRATAGKTNSDFNRSGWSILRLSSPVLQSAENYPTGGKVTWSNVKGATSYVVYRKTNSTGWKRLAVVDGNTNTSYIDDAAESGILYTYTVRAANGKTMSSYYSSGVALKYLAAPVLTTKVTASGVSLKWNKPTGTKTFRVYRKAAGEGWVVLKDTTATSFTDKTAKSGVTYTYAVRAINGKVISNLRKATVQYVGTPKLISAANGSDGITVKWGKVSGADGYRVYRKTPDGSWKGLANVSSVSYIDETAVAGETYLYTVRAFKGDDLGSYNSTGLKAVRVPEPELLPVENAENGVRVYWNPVEKADSYRVYRKAEGGSWEVLDTLKSKDVSVNDNGTLYYVDERVSEGDCYTYTVKAFCSGYGSSYCSTDIYNVYSVSAEA